MDYNLPSKTKIREKYLERRNGLTASELKEKSSVIMERVSKLPCVNGAKNILIYSSYRSEVITRPYIKKLLADKDKGIYLPVVNLNVIEFYRIDDIGELVPGYQGILEPLNKSGKFLFTEKEAADKCVCVTPGAVFDIRCGRMGYGKGFYDRFLSQYPDMIKVGTAFDVQISKTPIPREEHDIIMDYVITESGIMTAS